MKLTKKFIKDKVRLNMKTTLGYHFSLSYKNKVYVVYCDTDRKEVAVEKFLELLKGI